MVRHPQVDNRSQVQRGATRGGQAERGKGDLVVARTRNSQGRGNVQGGEGPKREGGTGSDPVKHAALHGERRTGTQPPRGVHPGRVVHSKRSPGVDVDRTHRGHAAPRSSTEDHGPAVDVEGTGEGVRTGKREGSRTLVGEPAGAGAPIENRAANQGVSAALDEERPPRGRVFRQRHRASQKQGRAAGQVVLKNAVATGIGEGACELKAACPR